MTDEVWMGLLVCAVAPVLFMIRIYRYRKAQAKASYPTVQGTITHRGLEVKEHVSTDSDNRREVSYEYIPKVEYAYTVAGHSYTGSRINVLTSKSSSHESEAQQVLSAYPLDATVQVFHNPQDPTDAFLENDPGKRMIDGGTWFAGITLVVIGLALMIFG